MKSFRNCDYFEHWRVSTGSTKNEREFERVVVAACRSR